LDQRFLWGTVQASRRIYRIVLIHLRQRNPPLDWAYPWDQFYTNQDSVLWVEDQEGHRLFLPQVVLATGADIPDESLVHIRLETDDFRPRYCAEVGWDFYRRTSNGGVRAHFFDGENARLLAWDPAARTFTFQGCRYFDYLKTNLALDVKGVVGSETLREYRAPSGMIEDLQASHLANATGINGLIFSNDGYMIFQARGDNVLIRPNELCPGFSGTIDKIDIEHVVDAGGTLDRLDAPREMVEELGIPRDSIVGRRFLGLTRELIRGGTPEMFYAIDVDLPSDVILASLPRDREGLVQRVRFGPFAASMLDESEATRLPEYFWSLVRNVHAEGRRPVSVPLQTNLVLWYWLACPNQTGVSGLR
jgi:hypothetical protein